VTNARGLLLVIATSIYEDDANRWYDEEHLRECAQRVVFLSDRGS
jgi:hypothetical protein